ncbi:hypothetical protein KP509_1Z157000 [Ceratopteris richardii]|nr:hypothetical protein KP509_1Z157000 [Ceratopteris richardii]
MCYDCTNLLLLQGCDGSVLLDATSTVTGETASPNNNSLRGFDVVDNIKTAVEAVCPGTVSCADILALAANAPLGDLHGLYCLSKDATSPATVSEVNSAIPSPNSNMTFIISQFAAVGLNVQDTVVLSGAHTIGQARCISFSSRLYNFSGTGSPDPSINPVYLRTLQSACPKEVTLTLSGNWISPPRLRSTMPTTLICRTTRVYYSPIKTPPLTRNTAPLAAAYAGTRGPSFTHLGRSMVKMGNISPLTGTQGEIRLNCRVVNPS